MHVWGTDCTSLVETISPEVVVALHIALEYYFAVTTAINLYAGWSTMTKGVQAEELVSHSLPRIYFLIMKP
jgi:hypothetical protein